MGRKTRDTVLSFANPDLQRWLGSIVVSGRLDREDPYEDWPGTPMAAPRRLWSFPRLRRWVWTQSREFQAFEEFDGGPGREREAGELNGVATAALAEGESPTTALFRAVKQFQLSGLAGLGELMQAEKGGFAVYSRG